MSIEADLGRGGSKSWPRVLAPGKVFLAGEYGVLEGAPALVMAINRHVSMRAEEPESIEGWLPARSRALETEQTNDPLLEALIEEARAIARLPDTPFQLNTRELYSSSGHKLGLGSSAAKAAAVITGAFLLAGEDPNLPSTRRRILQAALRAHRSAGGGSGADVAASVLGGAVEYRLIHDKDGGNERCFSAKAFLARKVELPCRSIPLIVHGDSPVSTRHALFRLDAAMKSGSITIEKHLQTAADAGERLALCLMDPTAPERDLLEHVDQTSNALLELTLGLGLGEGSGRSTLEAAAKIARDLGGAAKPSGAGGGDLVLVFVPALSLAERCHAASALDRAGLHVLDVAIDDEGVREWPTEEDSIS